MVTLVVALLATSRLTTWQTIPVAKGWTVEIPKGMTELKVAPEKGVKSSGRAFTDGDAIYTVTIASTSSGKSADKSISDVVTNICHTLSPATVKFQRDVLLNGWPGLENVILGHDDTAVCMRTYDIDGTIYRLGVGYTSDSGRPDTSERFLTSLKGNSVAPGPLITPGPVFQSFQPPTQSFSIFMPGTPRVEDEKITAAGPNTVSHRYLAEYGNRVYIAGYVDLESDVSKASEGDQVKLLTLLLDHAASGLNAKPDGPPKPVTRNGVVFQFINAYTSDGVAARIEATLEGNRGFAAVMVFPYGHAGSSDIEQFFNSFKLPGRQ
jgi:hypothetical protein